MRSVENLVRAVMAITKDNGELNLLHDLSRSASVLQTRCLDNDVKIVMLDNSQPPAKDYVQSAIGCANSVRYYSKRDVEYVRDYLSRSYLHNSFEIRGNNSVFVRVSDKDIFLYMPIANFPVSETCKSIGITSITKEQEKVIMRKVRQRRTGTAYSKFGNVMLAESDGSRKYYVIS